jgi:hypothetical protein
MMGGYHVNKATLFLFELNFKMLIFIVCVYFWVFTYFIAFFHRNLFNAFFLNLCG